MTGWTTCQTLFYRVEIWPSQPGSKGLPGTSTFGLFNSDKETSLKTLTLAVLLNTSILWTSNLSWLLLNLTFWCQHYETFFFSTLMHQRNKLGSLYKVTNWRLAYQSAIYIGPVINCTHNYTICLDKCSSI